MSKIYEKKMNLNTNFKTQPFSLEKSLKKLEKKVQENY